MCEVFLLTENVVRITSEYKNNKNTRILSRDRPGLAIRTDTGDKYLPLRDSRNRAAHLRFTHDTVPLLNKASLAMFACGITH